MTFKAKALFQFKDYKFIMPFYLVKMFYAWKEVSGFLNTTADFMFWTCTAFLNSYSSLNFDVCQTQGVRHTQCSSLHAHSPVLASTFQQQTCHLQWKPCLVNAIYSSQAMFRQLPQRTPSVLKFWYAFFSLLLSLPGFPSNFINSLNVCSLFLL